MSTETNKLDFLFELGCEELPPGSRDTCNDNCIFDYQYNCIPSCET